MQMTSQDLLRKLDGAPFKPFRMKMVSDVSYDVRDPGMVIVGDSSAVVATEDIRDADGHAVTTDWRTISEKDEPRMTRTTRMKKKRELLFPIRAIRAIRGRVLRRRPLRRCGEMD